jgi:hypothetical protein
MKKSITCLFLLLHVAASIAQYTDSTVRNQYGRNHSIALELSLPIAAFASSHFIGAGLEYSWADRRYGINAEPRKTLGFTFHGGASYFLGKKTNVAGNDFRFGGYTYLHALAGAIVNPYARTNISLTAGPAVSIYKGNSDFGAAVKLCGSYYVRNSISIGPAVMYRKHSRVESLWSIMLRGAFVFP